MLIEKAETYQVAVTGLTDKDEISLVKETIESRSNKVNIFFTERVPAGIFVVHENNKIDLLIVTERVFKRNRDGIEATFATHSYVGVISEDMNKTIKTKNKNIFFIHICKKRKRIIGL